MRGTRDQHGVRGLETTYGFITRRMAVSQHQLINRSLHARLAELALSTIVREVANVNLMTPAFELPPVSFTAGGFPCCRIPDPAVFVRTLLGFLESVPRPSDVELNQTPDARTWGGDIAESKERAGAHGPPGP